MTTNRVLVLTAGEGNGLPEAIHDRVDGARTEVLVVTPATTSRLRRWASDVDAARRVAGERARHCAAELRRSGFAAEAVVGDADPAQAIDDALAVFDADVLVVDRPLAERARRRRFSLPIVSIDVAA